MRNPVVVQDCDIQIDTKRHEIEITNHARHEFNIESGSIQVSAPEGSPEASSPIRAPFIIHGEEIKRLPSELDQAVTLFDQIHQGPKDFKVRIAITGTVGGERKAQHATFSAEFADEGYEIDQYPFESGVD
jgi:hypothetical protein